MRASDPGYTPPEDLTIGPWEPKRSAGIVVKYVCHWSNGRSCAHLRDGDVRISKYTGQVIGVSPFNDESRFGWSPYRLWSWEDISLLFALKGYILPPVPDNRVTWSAEHETSAGKWTPTTFHYTYCGGPALSSLWYSQWRKGMTWVSPGVTVVPAGKPYEGEGIGATLPNIILPPIGEV